MAIAFVRATEGNIDSTALTLNIQVSAGANRVLVVGLAYKSNSVITPTSIVFNSSENFTIEQAAADGGDAQCFLAYLTAPTETTADVVITLPSAVRMVGFVAYFTGVDQTTPFTANTNEAQGTDAAPTVNVSSAADEMCIDIMAQVSAGPDTATPSHTAVCNGAQTGGGTDCRGAGQYVVGTTSRTMDYSMSGSDNWNIVAGALQEPQANNYEEFPADTIGLTDTDTVVRTVIRTITESLGITDTDASELIMIRLITESLGLTDTDSVVLNLVRTIAESMGLTDTDTVTRIVVRLIAESLGISDAESSAAEYFRTFNESMGTADDMGQVANAIRSITDTLGTTDSLSTLIAFNRFLSDDVGITDETLQLLSSIRQINDGVGLTDNMARVWNVTRVLAETMGLTDVVDEVLGGLVEEIADNLGITDSMSPVHSAFRTVADSVGLVDAITRVLAISRLVTDQEGITDQTFLNRFLVVADNLGLTDEATRLLDYIRVNSDDIGLTDIADRAMVIFRIINDGVGISDVATEQFGDVVKAVWAFLILRKKQN